MPLALFEAELTSNYEMQVMREKKSNLCCINEVYNYERTIFKECYKRKLAFLFSALLSAYVI